MLLVILGISLAMLITGIIIYYKCSDSYDVESLCTGLIASGIAFAAITLIVLLVMGIELSDATIIDDKIALYQKENAEIETQISAVVENYMQYESETFTQFKNDNPTILVSLFPELKSDTLVAKQLETYIANNTTIKELECEKLGYRVLRWWIYFGGQ